MFHRRCFKGVRSWDRQIENSGMYVVGKCSWKDRDVGEFLVGKFFPSSSLYMGDR